MGKHKNRSLGRDVFDRTTEASPSGTVRRLVGDEPVVGTETIDRGPKEHRADRLDDSVKATEDVTETASDGLAGEGGDTDVPGGVLIELPPSSVRHLDNLRWALQRDQKRGYSRDELVRIAIKLLSADDF